MAWLKIRSFANQNPQQHIKKASISLTALLVMDREEDKQSSRDTILESMGSSSLSDWFLLYTYVISSQLKQVKFESRNLFLEAVRSVHLERLNHELVFQCANICASLQQIERQQTVLSTKSSINLSQTLKEGERLVTQSARLQAQLTQCKQETPARFHLIANMVSIIETIDTAFSAASIKEMLYQPRAFIGAMAAIFVGLQGIDQEGVSAKNIYQMLHHAIKGTLTLIGIEDRENKWVLKIQHELFEKKYVGLLERTFLSTQPVVVPDEMLDDSVSLSLFLQ